jgi:hypothetical protein
MIFSEDCMRKLPLLWITFKGNFEGGTVTSICRVVSLLRVFRPLSSTPERVPVQQRDRQECRGKSTIYIHIHVRTEH